MADNDNDDIDWDEMEDKHRDQTERTDRARKSSASFAETVTEMYRRQDAGDLNATVSAYDKHTAVLLAALEEADELERVVDELQADIAMDASGDATKSQLLVAAVRYAIGHVDEDLLEEAREGYAAVNDTPF